MPCSVCIVHMYRNNSGSLEKIGKEKAYYETCFQCLVEGVFRPPKHRFIHHHHFLHMYIYGFPIQTRLASAGTSSHNGHSLWSLFSGKMICFLFECRYRPFGCLVEELLKAQQQHTTADQSKQIF